MDPESRKSGVLARGAWIGKYEILRKLATGGMAEIYLARITGTGRFEKLVVLKCILPAVAEDEHVVEMFLGEARLAASLHHPNIADVYDVGHEGSTYYYAMEFVHGQDVRAIRAEAKQQHQRVPIVIATSIIVGLAAALDYAHNRPAPDGSPLELVHRDVTASNVMVSYDGAIKLVDFGIARARSVSRRTQAGTLKGKVPYMSPEQCQGLELDRRSDLFSLGVVLYELTVGRRPFRGDSDFAIMDQIIHGGAPAPTSLVANYPTDLDAIVMRLLQSEPANRYATAADLIHDLERFIAQHSLWQSPRAVSNYMRTLFAERFAAWEEAEREGVPFAQRVVQSISPNSVVTPLTPSPTKAPAGPASQPFAAFEPLEGITEMPGSSASFLGARAMAFDETEAPLVLVAGEPTNVAHPPPIEAVKTSVTPPPFLPESLSAPVEPHGANLPAGAPAARSRESEPRVPSDFLHAPADPADALATTVSPPPFVATISRDELKVATDFTDVSAESGTMRTHAAPANEQTEERGRKAAQARARQASQQQEDARREAREQAEAVRKTAQVASRANADAQHEEESARRALIRTPDAQHEDAYQQATRDAARQQQVADARRQSEETASSSTEEAGEDDEPADVGAPIDRASASSAAEPPARAVPSAPTAVVYPTLGASKATKLARILLLLLVLFGAGVSAYLVFRMHC